MPKLSAFKGFLPYISVVFINAFVDLGHKIVIQNTVFKVYDGNEQVLLTAIVNALILIPFILLFSPSGFLSDKYPKHLVMRYSAWAVVVATVLITLCYYLGWFWWAFGLTLLLAIQSAIYSPAKYGYIKELVGNEPLARANGVVNATSILGILLGTFVFSGLFEWMLMGQAIESPDDILLKVAPLGWFLVALAIAEVVLVYRLEAKSETRVDQRFEFARYVKLNYLNRNIGILLRRPAIWLSIVGLSTFWAIAQVVLAAFPAFAKENLGETNTLVIQGILACTGLGIVLGSVLAGRLSRNYIELGLIPVGALGLTAALFIMPGLDSPAALAVCFLAIGTMGGLFIVPLNALIQFHALPRQLGTVLAGNNWIQNVTMLSFLGITVLVATLNVSAAWLLGALGFVSLIGAGYTLRKLPHAFTRLLVSFIFKGRYRIAVMGFKNLPSEGAALLLGNHISWIDWALVQIASPRPVRFVMQREIYNHWLLKPFLKIFGVIPIAKGHSEDALVAVNALLRAGEVVCLFPEGAISRNGQLGKFHTGFERAAKGVEAGVIVPFYLHGLWGSQFSRSSDRLRDTRAPQGTRRDLIVAFGKGLPMSTNAKQLKQSIFDVSVQAWDEYSDGFDSTGVALLKSAKAQGGQVALREAKAGGISYRALATEAIVVARSLKKLELEASEFVINADCARDTLIATFAVLLVGGSIVIVDVENPHATAVIIKSSLPEAKGLDSTQTATTLSLQTLARKNQPVKLLLALSGWLLSAKWFSRLWCACIYRSRDLDAPAIWGERGALSHRQIQLNSQQLSDVLNTKDNDVVGGFMGQKNAFALMLTRIMPLLEGLPVVHAAAEDDVVSMAKKIARSKVTLLCASAELLQTMVANDAIESLMFESVRMAVIEQGPQAQAAAEAFEQRFNSKVYVGFAGASAAAVACINVPDALDTAYWRVQRGHHVGSVGLPLPGQSLKIFDDKGNIVESFGTAGRIGIACGARQLMRLDKANNVLVETNNRSWLLLDQQGLLDEEGFLSVCN